MTVYEFRTRSSRVPESRFPTGEIRVYLGEATTKADQARMIHQREVLKKLFRRGQWSVLRGLVDGQLTVEQVVRIADERGMDAIEVEIRDPGAGRPLGEMVERFLGTVENERTEVAYRGHLQRLVEHLGESKPWDRVGRHEMNEILDAMRGDGLAANTRAAAKTAWSAFYTWAMDLDESKAELAGRPPRLSRHPVQGTKKVQTAVTRQRFLSHEELDVLLGVAIRPIAIQYLTLALTGMRVGEFMSRRPEDIDLPSAIRIVPRDDWAPKGWPNHDHGVRDIPIHRTRLLPALEEYQRDYAGDQRFFVNPRTVRPWVYQAFRKQLYRDLEEAGLPWGRDTPDGITLHTFRHTLGSWLAQADVQLKKIALILGNTVEITDRYYAHLLPRDLDQTINRVLK